MTNQTKIEALNNDHYSFLEIKLMIKSLIGKLTTRSLKIKIFQKYLTVYICFFRDIVIF